MTLLAGLVSAEKIAHADFSVDLIPEDRRRSQTMRPEWITVHNTGNTAAGANAEMHTRYVDGAAPNPSWHFTVDDKDVFQELPVHVAGYHAGDGDGQGNNASIGIEICVNEGIDWERAKDNAVALIAKLCTDLEIDSDHVVPHRFWSGKYCPARILDEGWIYFHRRVSEEVRRMEKPDKWAEDAYTWALENGVTDGTRPRDTATRQEVVTMVYNAHRATLKAVMDAIEKTLG